MIFSIKTYIYIAIAVVIAGIVSYFVYTYKSLKELERNVEVKKKVDTILNEKAYDDKIKVQHKINEGYTPPCEYNCTVIVQ